MLLLLLLLQVPEHRPLLLLELSHGGHVDIRSSLPPHVQARLPRPSSVHVHLWAPSRHDVNGRPPCGSGPSAWAAFILGGPLFDECSHELRVGAQDVEHLLLLVWRAGRAQSPQQLLEGRLRDVPTGRDHSGNTSSSRERALLNSTSSALLLLHVDQGSLTLTLTLVLLRWHQTCVSHLIHHSLALLGGHALVCPLWLRVLVGGTHPLLLKLYLRGQLPVGEAALLGGLLHGSACSSHHPLWTTLGLLHVRSTGGRWGRGLRGDPLRAPYPDWPRVSQGHLRALPLWVVRRHHACLSLQSHLPLSIGDLLDPHGDLYCCGWGPRRGRLRLLLLRNGGLALRLARRVLAYKTTSHHGGAGLLLGRGHRAEDGLALGLVNWGGAWRPVGVQRQIVVMLLKLLRLGPRATLLLQLNMRKHLLLMLRGAHHAPGPAPSAPHLLELVVERVLRRHPAGLLLDPGYRAQALLRDRRHSLSRGLGCWGLRSTRGRRARCRGSAVPWRGKPHV